jgi:glycosyltransferase involved in cell wall biosynthesis
MNVLFLSRWFPDPPNNGSKIRIYHLLQGLSQQHDVTFLSFSDRQVPDRDRKSPFLCSEIQVVPWKPYDKKSAKARLGFFSSTPRSLVDTYSPEMDSRIREVIKTRKIDIVVASQLSMASYYPSFQGVPALFEELELGLFHQQLTLWPGLRKRLQARLSWFKLKKYLSKLLDAFGGGTVVSAEEYRILADQFGKHKSKIHILPNFINTDDYQNIVAHKRQNHLIFSGSFSYLPNYHAMLWFIRDVFPLVLSQLPDAQLIITGDPGAYPLPESKNVTHAGYVEDVKSLIASCDISLAPLWFGGGTRLKIVEAMAIGTPVIATSKGAEGLQVQDGKHILIADKPDEFARYVIDLLREPGLRSRLSENAKQLVRANYDWKVIKPGFLSVVEHVAAGMV